MSVRKSFSYGPLSYANGVGSSLNRGKKVSEEDEDWVYYSHRKSDVGGGGGGGGCCSDVEDASAGLVYETSSSSLLQRRSILPWRKRKLSFRSPKAKGEPLLKKDNGEEGGDDIDYDRRQLSSDEALVVRSHQLLCYLYISCEFFKKLVLGDLYSVNELLIYLYIYIFYIDI